MKIFVSLLVFLISFSAFSEQHADYDHIKTKSGKWKLVWNDEFDKPGLPDQSKWTFDTIGNSTGWGNREKQYYTYADSNNVKIRNGILTITARVDSIHGKAYTSVRLITKDKENRKYGRFEIRAKLPTGSGTWPAIWMLPTKQHYGNWPSSGEIDPSKT